MILSLIFVAALILGDPRYVIFFDPMPPAERPRDRVAQYSALCLSSSLANVAVRTKLGLETGTDPYAGLRQQAAELALESPNWGYVDVAATMIERAATLTAPLTIVVASLEKGVQPQDFPDSERLFQVQSDCQEEHAARVRASIELEVARLDGIASGFQMQECAAIDLERADRQDDARLERRAAALMEGVRQLRSEDRSQNPAEPEQLNFDVAWLLDAGTLPDGSLEPWLLARFDQCDAIAEALLAADHIPPY